MSDLKIVEVHSDSVTKEQVDQIIQFCKEALDENKHAARENMQVDGWETKPSSLLYLLLIEKRFSEAKGGLQLLFLNEKIVAVSGYYSSDFDPNIYFIGVRSWVLKEHRFNLLIANWLLPFQLNEVQKRRGHTAAISFNDSTKSFGKLIERSNRNSDTAIKFFFGEKYPDIYRDMIFWDKPLRIKNVKQWVLIKRIAPSDFDWNSLAWQDSDQ